MIMNSIITSKKDKVASLTTTNRDYEYSTVEGWVGMANDSWSSVSSFSGNPGDIVFIPICFTDRDNRVGYMRGIVNSYSGTTLYMKNDSIILYYN